MHSVQLFLGLLLCAVVIALIAKRLDQPYPIALVLAGLGLALLPGMPAVDLDPELVFFLLLPPVLSEAAFFTSWRDFLRLKRPILLLAFGLVAATTATVAAICAFFIPGMNWTTGLVLGAIISPPDAAAATSITRGLRLPRRITQILEGESLVNDASGLTLYRFAVLAIVTGTFSWADAILSFLWMTLGGIAIGLALSWALVKVFHHLKDPDVEIISTFLVSYLSYFAAESLHASGVLATVASGLLLGWHAPEIFSANGRIRGLAVWQTVIFVVNTIIFLLIGLQLPRVVGNLGGYPRLQLAAWAAEVLLAVILIRLLWVYVAAYLPHALFPRIRRMEVFPSPQGVFVVGWTGLRGVLSLAAALALPLETANGLPFPYRNLLLFLAFTTILGTLLLQGLSLRPIIRLLKLPEDRSSEEEQLTARISTTERVLEYVLEMEEKPECTSAALARIKSYYEDRLAELRARLEIEQGSEPPTIPNSFTSLAEQRIWWRLAKIERETLIDLRRNHVIGDEALHEVEREIDLLEARIIPQSH
jgi:monovalent cation/hydrogen antiporter